MDKVNEYTELCARHAQESVDAMHSEFHSASYVLAHAQLAAAYSQLAHLEFLRAQQ